MLPRQSQLHLGFVYRNVCSRLLSLSACIGSPSVMTRHENDKISLETIKKAADRIKGHVHRTPILTSSYLNTLSGRKLFFKCENFQRTGSFKVRGVTNALLRVKEERKDEAFISVTHSSGNHAQALALGVKLQNLKGKVVMPFNAPQTKKNAVLGYGADIFESEPTAEGRHQRCLELLEELGEEGEYIPSADHPFIMEGQGTLALEMLEDVSEKLDAVIVACSVGGLLGGVAVACKQTNPDMKVYAVEPKLADELAESFKANERRELKGYPDTIADALRLSVGEHTWPVIRENVEDVITVTDDEIIHAMFLIWERMKVIVEPSGAVAFAAVLSEQFRELPASIKNVGIVLCGGNLDLEQLPWVKVADS